jgi:hypothetical protein
VIYTSEGSSFSQNFIYYISSCQVPCGSRKVLARTSLQCCYIFMVFRDWYQHVQLSKNEYFSSRNVADFYYPSWRDSTKFKPRLQFSSNFVVISASEGSSFFENFGSVAKKKLDTGYSLINYFTLNKCKHVKYMTNIL